MKGISHEKLIHPEVDFIVLNNTRRPTTGGDYVYAVMKDELTTQGYHLSEMSIPSLVEPVRNRFSRGIGGSISLLSAEALAYIRCYISSLRKFRSRSRLMITSSCPTFPVFGHLTYHQPKAGIRTDFIKQSGSSMKRMIGYRIQENDKFSPMWLPAKKLMIVHLSNSAFTQGLVKEIYGLDSKVLYPPVPVLKYLKANLNAQRKPYVYINRPQAITGIALLPQITKHLSKDIKVVITGKLDQAGNKTLQALKNAEINFEYLGFVEESVKIDILTKSSVYINLSVNEPFGISVVEALAAGCIPLAHDSGGIREFLPSDFRYSSVGECAEKVAAFINSENRQREQLRRIALRFDEANFRRGFMFYVARIEDQLKMGSEEMIVNNC